MSDGFVDPTSSGASVNPLSLLTSMFVQLGAVTNAGGSNAGSDQCLDVAVDSSGNIYCAGFTRGPMSEGQGGNDDAFVMKLDTSGNILWHTQLGAVTNAGGSNAGDDRCTGVAVDSVGNVYCAGQTTGGMSEASGGSNDAFVMKLDSSGNIIWHTQLGGVTNAGGSNAGDDICNGVAVDSAGNVYCAGYTLSGMSEANAGGYDAFVMKLDSSGNILWHTQLGGVTNAGGSNAGNDRCYGVAVDTTGNVYCAGYTSGGMSEASGGSNDVFVMKLDSSGNILWHTQLGAVTNAGGSNAGTDYCDGVAVDSSGNVYCAGYTSGAMSEASGGSDDAFVMKLDSSGNVLWHTQLGGVTNAGGSNASSDYCYGVAVDSAGNVYCAGLTSGGMSEASGGGFDAFVMKLDSSGNILWHTQLGGVTNAGGSNLSNDYCYGVAVDTAGNVYCAGYTNGGMSSEGSSGGGDVFIMRLEPDGNFNP